LNQNRKEFVNRFKERLHHLLDEEGACHLLENVVSKELAWFYCLKECH
jgi:hypothetical protein